MNAAGSRNKTLTAYEGQEMTGGKSEKIEK